MVLKSLRVAGMLYERSYIDLDYLVHIVLLRVSKVGSQSGCEVEVRRPSSSEFSCVFIGSRGIFQDLVSTSCT